MELPKKGTISHQYVEDRLLGSTRLDEHREKDGTANLRLGVFASHESYIEALGLVALPLKPKQWKLIPEAMKAAQKEFNKLQTKGAWDLKTVCEWSDVTKNAARSRASDPDYKGQLVGMIFQLCVVKSSEVPSLRKYKGRFVVQRNTNLD